MSAVKMTVSHMAVWYRCWMCWSPTVCLLCHRRCTAVSQRGSVRRRPWQCGRFCHLIRFWLWPWGISTIPRQWEETRCDGTPLKYSFQRRVRKNQYQELKRKMWRSQLFIVSLWICERSGATIWYDTKVILLKWKLRGLPSCDTDWVWRGYFRRSVQSFQNGHYQFPLCMEYDNLQDQGKPELTTAQAVNRSQWSCSWSFMSCRTTSPWADPGRVFEISAQGERMKPKNWL